MYKPVRIMIPIVMLVTLVAAAPAALAQVPSKVGVFDSQRISEETAEGKRVQEQLNSLRDQKQQEIAAMEQVIADLQQRLNQQGLSLSADTRTSMEIDIQRRALEVNNAKDLATRQLQLEVAAAEAQFNDKLRLVVQQFGRDEGFAVLFEINTTAWASNTVDVTTALIDLFDKLYPPAAG
jgi:Skp family chaperone for outer membrane proteins